MPGTAEKDPDPRSYLQILSSAVLRWGPMPIHVAFIMNGSRRFARKNGLTSIKGYEKGHLQLENVIHWALALRIPTITCYPFSMEKVKRNKEIGNLMELLHSFLNRDTNIRFQILGNWDLIPDQWKPLIGKLHLQAREKPRRPLTVNIAFAYTSRDTMIRSAKAICDGHETLAAEDVTERVFQELHCLLPIPSVDLLIRTGGKRRLTDLMLWESTYAQLEFLKVTWPEFTFWEFCKTIFRFEATPRMENLEKGETLTKKQLEFISMHRNKMWEEMEAVAERYVEPQGEENVIVLKNNWFKKAFTAFIDS